MGFEGKKKELRGEAKDRNRWMAKSALRVITKNHIGITESGNFSNDYS